MLNYKDKLDLKDKKIEKLKQRIIDLQTENVKLKGDLELGRKDKDEGYQQAKQMIQDIGKIKELYDEAIKNADIAKEAYLTECANLKEWVKKAKKENAKTVKYVKKKGGEL